MANRPCKPGADVKQIWRMLLPDMPFPACGTQDDNAADARDSAALADKSQPDARLATVYARGAIDAAGPRPKRCATRNGLPLCCRQRMIRLRPAV